MFSTITSQFASTQDEKAQKEAYDEIILSIPENERKEVLAELNTSSISNRANRLQEQLLKNTPIIEDETNSRALFLAALLLLKQNKITVGQCATLHILDAAIKTLYTHFTLYAAHNYVNAQGQPTHSEHVQLLLNPEEHMLPMTIRNYPYNSILVPKDGISLSELPREQQSPLLFSFFNMTNSEWEEFCSQMSKAPKSEQSYYILNAPETGCWSYLIYDVQRALGYMKEFTWLTATKDGDLHQEKIMLVPSLTMFQAAINAKAKTLNRKPVELLPTYGYIEANHYAALKTSGKIALAMYLPEKKPELRYHDHKGAFRASIDGHGFEGAFAGAIHDVYHAMREMAMTENVAKARMRLASIAKNHPKNKIGFRAVDDVLVDGELIFSYPAHKDTLFKSRPHQEKFGDIFYTAILKGLLHADLKRDFIKDMVINKNLWKEQFNLDKSDLRSEDQKIYDAIQAEQSNANSNNFGNAPATSTMGVFATRAPTGEKNAPMGRATPGYAA